MFSGLGFKYRELRHCSPGVQQSYGVHLCSLGLGFRGVCLVEMVEMSGAKSSKP